MANNVDRRASTASMESQRTIAIGGSFRNSNLNVLADEFAADSFLVADGFRPPPPSNDANTRRPRTPPRINERRSIALQPPTYNPPPKTKQVPAMSLNQLGIASRNSFSLRHDAQQSDPPQRMSSMASTLNPGYTSRPLSTISNFTIPRSQSPFVGASGPSHPYDMYHQNTSLNRASSSSTVRPTERPYAGADRPMHPYGLYPQSTAAEGESDPLMASTDIASVGFPGLGQQYARRLGPDGEDADDIIGPDGHTEQLPPYTRYPDRRGETRSLQTKERAIPVTETSAPSSPELGWTPPMTASMTDALLPGRARCDGDAPAVDNDNTSTETESTKEKWTKKSKKRTCFGRLPYWSLCLMVFALVILAAMVGALIGHFIPSRQHSDNMHHSAGSADHRPSSTVYSVTTTIIDAATLAATPTPLPAITTGSFKFPMQMVSKNSTGCLQNPQQQVGWSCSIGGSLEFEVTNPAYDAAQLLLNGSDNDGHRSYGPQPPIFNTSTRISLMMDKEAPGLGPAYYFSQFYDKLVIVPSETLSKTGSNTRRWTEESINEMARLTERGGDDSLHEGDTPWFCFWNYTLLEGFIYIMKDINPEANTSTTTGAGQTLSMTPPAPSFPPMPVSLMPVPPVPGPSPPAQSSDQSLDQGSPPRRSESDKGHFHKHGRHGEDKDKESWHGHNGGWDQDKDSGSSWSAQYPKWMKIMERRFPMLGPQPYCQQMKIDAYQNPTPYMVNNKPQIVNLTEKSPEGMKRAVYNGGGNGVHSRTNKGRRDDDSDQADGNICQCEWQGF